VSRDLGGALRALVAPTVALLVVSVFIPGRLPLAVRIYALVIAAVALAVALGELRRSHPRTRPLRPLEREPSNRRPPSTLAHIEHETALGVAGAFDLHFRLVPHVRAIATGLLVSRRSISVETAPNTARSIVGPETWDLVRLDRPPPEDRLARGLPISELRRVVDSMEKV
jgi:hypothetical protein